MDGGFVATILLGVSAGFQCMNSIWKNKEVLEKLDGVSNKVNEVQALSDKVGELEKLVSELKSQYRTDPDSVREIVHLVNEELKKDQEKHLPTGVYVFSAAAAVLAVGYGCMYKKGITMCDIYNGTKRRIATGLSTVTKCIEKNSAAVTERMKHVSEKLEKYAKLYQENDDQVFTEASTPNQDQEFADSLLKLVMTEGEGYDEDILGKVFDHLNEHQIVARDFLSKSSEMRKKWLKEFELEERLEDFE